MIANERQYKVTKGAIEKFQNAIAEAKKGKPRKGVSLGVYKLQIESMIGQLETLEEEVREYERLISGTVKQIDVDNLEQLPEGLIKARLALNLTQRQLGERLSLKEQQIQRYEATRYASASFARLVEIAEALGVRIKERIFVREKA